MRPKRPVDVWKLEADELLKDATGNLSGVALAEFLTHVRAACERHLRELAPEVRLAGELSATSPLKQISMFRDSDE